MMSGFGIDPFSQFADEPDATEDPFGVAASARETQWWTPYGASTRKKRGVTIGGFGGGGRRQTQTQGSYYDPNMAGPDPGYGTPSPSTTQRAILDAKQKQEDAARIFGGEAPRDTGAGGDFDLGGGGVMKYQAPDPTNPGQQDQARSATVDNAMLDEFRADEKRAKELEDAAMALPARTGITWGGTGTGSIEMKRNKYLQDAQILRARNAYRRASLMGGAGGPQDAPYVPVGHNLGNKYTGEFKTPPVTDPSVTARTGRTPAQQKPFPVGNDNRLVLQDPNDPQSLLPVGDKISAQGPPTPFARAGQDPFPSAIKQATAAKPAGIQKAEFDLKNPKPGKAKAAEDDEPDPIKVQAQHNNIDARFDRRLQGARSSEIPKIEAERKQAHEDADRRMGGSGGGGGGLDLSAAQIQAIKNGPKGKIAVINGRRYRATASGVEEVAR